MIIPTTNFQIIRRNIRFERSVLEPKKWFNFRRFDLTSISKFIVFDEIMKVDRALLHE